MKSTIDVREDVDTTFGDTIEKRTLHNTFIKFVRELCG